MHRPHRWRPPKFTREMGRHLPFCFSLGAFGGETCLVILENGRPALAPPRAADISHFVPLLKDFDVAKNLSRVLIRIRRMTPAPLSSARRHGWSSGEDLASRFCANSRAYIGTCGVIRHAAGNSAIGGQALLGPGYATEAASRLNHLAFDAWGQRN